MPTHHQSRTDLTSLAQVRAEIDHLDQMIIELLAKRQACVVRAGELKERGSDRAVRDPERVNAVIAGKRQLAQESGLSPDVAERTWRAMIDAFIDLELSINAERQPADEDPDYP